MNAMDIEWQAMRPGQRDAIEMIGDRIQRDERHSAIVLPTRYGKSDVIRIAALALRAEGLICCTLGLSPNVTLRDQLADVDNWNLAISRYRVVTPVGPAIVTLKKVTVRPNANDEVFVSATIQLAQINERDVRDWIESERHRTGLPVLVFVDESHTGSEENKWGKAAKAFAEAGAHVVLLTATPDRSDQKRIPGFRFETVEVEDDVRRYRTMDSAKGPEWIHVDVYEGQRTKLQLKADLEVSFEEAWNQNALCKLSRTPFDVDMLDDKGSHASWLSELSPTKIKEVLGRTVRRAEVVSEGVKRMVDDLHWRRAFQPDAAAIVFCGNDTDNDRQVNGHAKQIQAEIRRQDPTLRFEIVTTAETDAGADMLRAFCKGKYDGVIVKQMAGIGLDAPRVKTGLDLSPTRTYTALVQRMMRPATPYNGIMVATWISPDDVLSRAIFDRLVSDQGGEASATDLKKIDEYDQLRKEGAEADELFAGATNAADFQDSDGAHAHADRWESVDALLGVLPELGKIMPHATIASRLAGISVVTAAGEQSGVRDTGAACESIRHEVGGMMQELMRLKRVPAVPRSGYEEAIKQAWYVAKERASWPDPSLSIDRCSDVSMFESLRNALDRMRREVP
jgi:hypothetical protein